MVNDLIKISPNQPIPKKAVKQLPREVQPIAAEILNELRRLDKQVVKSFHVIGVAARKVRETLLPNCHFSYAEVMAEIAAQTEISERIIYDCMAFAAAVAPEDLPSLLKPEIRWGHIRLLVSNRSRIDFDEWVDRIRREKLTVAATADAMPLKAPALPRGPGRSPNVPQSLSAGLKRLDQVAGRFLNQMENALFAERFDLPLVIEFGPPDEMTEDMHKRLLDAATLMDRIAEFTAARAVALHDSIRVIEPIVQSNKDRDKQQKHVAPANPDRAALPRKRTRTLP